MGLLASGGVLTSAIWILLKLGSLGVSDADASTTRLRDLGIIEHLFDTLWHD